MMNILIIDTSSSYLKIALSVNGKEIFVDEKNTLRHIENLIPKIDSCLKKIKEDKSELKYVGVCVGPGSFTGLRIGISSILGISYAGKIPSFGFSVFDIYRFLLKESQDSLIIPIIDAKKNRFYCSFIESDKPIDMLDISADEILNKTKDIKKDIIFTGRDFFLIKDRFNLKYSYKYENDFSSREMLLFAKEIIKDQKSLKVPEPIYLRKSEAEIALINSKIAK